MGKFVLVYKGGPTPAEVPDMDAVMAAWMSWFGTLGDAVVDMGSPFGASTAVTSDGSADATTGLQGYTILTADSLDAAAGLAKGCPGLDDGGSVEVFEAMPM